MKVNHFTRIERQPVEMDGAHGCSVRWLISECDGAPTFAMRRYEVAPGGYTPKHSHPYEHEVFVLEGRGVVVEDTTEHSLAAGDVVFVAPNETHQFRNASDQPLKFLCIVPNSALNQQVPVAPECGTVQSS